MKSDDVIYVKNNNVLRTLIDIYLIYKSNVVTLVIIQIFGEADFSLQEGNNFFMLPKGSLCWRNKS